MELIAILLFSTFSFFAGVQHGTGDSLNVTKVKSSIAKRIAVKLVAGNGCDYKESHAFVNASLGNTVFLKMQDFKKVDKDLLIKEIICQSYPSIVNMGMADDVNPKLKCASTASREEYLKAIQAACLNLK